jgi:hypothetical protein
VTVIQQPLPADFPEPEPSDYETWAAEVRPAFVEVARTGRNFVCWHVARDYQLPDPPDRKRDWARLISDLHRDGLIEDDGFGFARDHSAVISWRGTREARTGRAA